MMRTLRFVLGLLALALVASVFLTGYVRYRANQQFSPQNSPPEVRLSEGELSTFSAAAKTPAGAARAPIVLVYHDIPARPNDDLEVSARKFAQQMAMLHAAGYRTLTGEEFAEVLRGRPAPPRSVLITFDDGTQGLWTYADRILAKYDFHAVGFLITRRLGERAGPYYLSWGEVGRMAASGRWTFGSHTRDSHHHITVSSSGETRSELVNRRWEAGKRESMRHFQRRVDADLRGSITDMTKHGLPHPRLFAFPFSEAMLPGRDKEALAYVVDRVDTLFDASFSAYSRSPESIGLRSVARKPPIHDRLQVTGSMTATELFAAMQRMLSMPVTEAAPLATNAHWSAFDGRDVPVRTDGSRLTVEASKRYVAAYYAAQATGDWVNYRISTAVNGLMARETVTATLYVRTGGTNAVQVRVSSRGAQVWWPTPRGPAKVVERRLPPKESHGLSIDVYDGRTVVRVDGATIHQGTQARSPSTWGGIGVAAFRGGTTTPFPTFTAMRVTSLGKH